MEQSILYSLVSKPADLNSNKTLLILHGFLGMSDNWKTLAAQYSENGFIVHAIDLRNHGRSFHTSEFSYELMVEDVLAYCNYHHIEKTNIIGHSMGGKVAMLFANRFPKKVEKLIIADIGPKYYEPHHQEILESLNAINFNLKPSRTEIENILKVKITDFGTRQFLLKNLYWRQQDQLAFRFNLDSFNRNIAIIGNSLNENFVYSKPTLFVRGGNSDYILDQDYIRIKKQFTSAEIVTIPNVGHWLHAENPIEFLKIEPQQSSLMCLISPPCIPAWQKNTLYH